MNLGVSPQNESQEVDRLRIDTGSKAEIGLGRRGFLQQVIAACGVVALGGLSGCEEAAEPEIAPPPVDTVETDPSRRQIKFLGNSIEILDGASFDTMRDKALQHLLLKFTTRKGKEPNETYWKRAIEEDFREVLVRMGRFELGIQDHAQSVGLDSDVLAYFGIEAGFNPLKRSPSGYCGLGQIGKDAISDTASILKRSNPEMGASIDIAPKEMNAWFDKRYDPLYGMLYGLAYLKLLGDRFPETIQSLLTSYSGSIQQWLESEVDPPTHQTRLDTVEKKLGISSTKGASYKARYATIESKIIPPEPVKIADPEGFAIHSYNMGTAGVAKLVFMNFVEASVEGKDIVNEDGVSIFSLDLVSDPDAVSGGDGSFTSFDPNMGLELRISDSEGAKTERQTYLWQAFAFKELMDKWHAVELGGTMDIEFNGKNYSLVKPATPTQEFTDELSHTRTIEIPAGVDLVQLAEHLGLSHEALRLVGRNAAFIRAGAYYGNPSSQEYSSGMVEIMVPDDKVELARTYIENSPIKVALYKVKKGDTADRILKRIQKTHPDLDFDRIFWDYNRIGRAASKTLTKGDILTFPSSISI